jgi:hypothetical protein
MKLFLVQGELITGQQLIARNPTMKDFVRSSLIGQVARSGGYGQCLVTCCELGPATMRAIDEYNDFESLHARTS